MRKSSLILSAVLLAGFAAPAIAQEVGVYVGTAPPPLRYETRGPEPYPGAYWVEGYWAPQGHHYRWVGGHWDRPPYANAYYSHPHWDHYREGWRYHEGRWDHDDEHNHHDHDRDHDDDRGHEHR